MNQKDLESRASLHFRVRRRRKRSGGGEGGKQSDEEGIKAEMYALT